MSEDKKMPESKRFVELQMKNLEISPQAIAFIRDAMAEKYDLIKVLGSPEEVARKLHFDLNRGQREDISKLHKKLSKMSPTEHEVLDYYVAVVNDGRHYNEWLVEPQTVAKQLDVKLSSKAADLIVREKKRIIDTSIGSSGGGETSSVVVAIIVTIGIVVMTNSVAKKPSVIDRSGRKKL